MPFVDISSIESIERKPGWHGRFFHSGGMTFVHYDFEAGSTVHRHFHPQEEVWQVMEGQLEVTVDGECRIAGPGTAAIVPPNVPHSVRAITNGKAIVVDLGLR